MAEKFDFEPVLQEINPQHPAQTNRWAACTVAPRIERLDHFAQIAPRNDLVHLQQKCLPTRSLAAASGADRLTTTVLLALEDCGLVA